MAHERIESKPNIFWKSTCGLDTHQRSSNHAQLDTPWNAFTADKRALVNTIWSDQIVRVTDSVDGSERCFVRLGMVSSEWKGVGKSHGKAAHENIRKAIEEQTPIFGFEAEPKSAVSDGGRQIKHFYLDRVSRLKPWYGLRGDDLIERLHLKQAFNKQIGLDPEKFLQDQGYLFELVEPGGDVPGASSSTRLDQPGEDKKVSDSEVPSAVSPESGDDEEPVDADAYAAKALPVLVHHVLQQRDNLLVPMTYQQLAERIGRRNKHGEPWARGLGHILGKVTQLVEEAWCDDHEKPPYLTTIVVLKSSHDDGLPDDGVKIYWPDYEHLTKAERRTKVLQEYERILHFGSGWNDVLQRLGLTPIASSDLGDKGTTGGWGGGESDAHKAMEEFVASHPELFGADASFTTLQEYPLRSGDAIDVFFKSAKVWVGVEVKSKVSDGLLSDYQRGVYQVVKYTAVLKAQAMVDHPHDCPSVKVLLALESGMPRQFALEAKSLGVEFIEHLGGV